MPSKYRLRPVFAPLIRGIARICIKLHITPNGATWIMLLWAIFAAAGFWISGCFVFLSIGIFLTGIMDGVDGAIARLTNRSTPFGGFFDSTMDRISEGILLLGIAGGSLIHSPLIAFWPNILIWDYILFSSLLIFSLLISYTRTRCEVLLRSPPTKSSDTSAYDTNIGTFGRSERLFYLVILSLIGFILILIFGAFTAYLVFRIGLWILTVCLILMVSYRMIRYRTFLKVAG